MKNLTLFDAIQPTLVFEEKRFKLPDNCFAPMYFWTWLSPVTKQSIVEQIDEMVKQNIRALTIVAHPSTFDTILMRSSMSPEYLSDEFFELVRFAVEYGVSKGITFWLYDEGGWRSGMASGQVVKALPKMAEKMISDRKIKLKKGEKYQAGEHVIATYYNGDRVTQAFTAEEDCEVTEYYLYFLTNGDTDPSEPESVDKFIELTHERYKQYVGEYFGKDISIMFTDEPRSRFPGYVYGFEEKFLERYGYDIRDYLPEIMKTKNECYTGEVYSNDLGIGDKVRMDFCRLNGELFRDSLLKKQKEWNEKNGLLGGGHFGQDHGPMSDPLQSRTNIVDVLRQMAVPGVDTIWRQIMPDYKDFLVEEYGAFKNSFFPRFASSAAHENGTNLALSECFGVYGCGTTMDQMRYVLNYQLVRGINLFCFQARCSESTREEYFLDAEKYIPFNDYVTRACYINSIGESCIDTAVYLPENDICAGAKLKIHATNHLETVGKRLERSGIEFDIIEDYGIENAILEDDGIVIGKRKYKHVYIPNNRYMSESVREKLAPYLTEASPVCQSSAGFEALRVAKRKSQKEEIYYCYNEGCSKLATELTFESDKRFLYELDLKNGNIYLVLCKVNGNKKSFSITLVQGESKAFVLSNDILETVENGETANYEKQIVCKDFTAKKVKEFTFDLQGMYKQNIENDEFTQIELGDWRKKFGEDFSGYILYRTKVCLDETPKGSLLLDLGKVASSAEIKVNEKYVGATYVEPMRLVIDKKYFKKGENILDITLINTVANTRCISDVYKDEKSKALGLFHYMSLEFEKESLESGLFGPVVLKY